MSNLPLLPTSERILIEIRKGLESRQKAIEVDMTLGRLRIEVHFDLRTHAPKRVSYHHLGEDLIDYEKKSG